MTDSSPQPRLSSPLRILEPDLSDSYFNAADILLSMKNSAIFRASSTCQSTWSLSPPPMVGEYGVQPRMNTLCFKDTPDLVLSDSSLSSTKNEMECKLPTFGDLQSGNGEKAATSAITQHQCKFCKKTYGRLPALKAHLKLHFSEKGYKCDDCGKLFSQQANLKAHFRTHTGEKPFQCKVCKRRFAQSSSVTTHMRTHSGERPYQCKICGRGFADSSTLNKHIRVHTGERPYMCHVCHTRFSQSGNLKRHMSVHQKQGKFRQGSKAKN